MSLPILPVELVALCISFVDDISTLAAICQTGTLGKKVATPLLYRNVGVLGDHRRLYRLQHLCQRLLENPHLAGNVRQVTQSVQENSTVLAGDLTLDMERCTFEWLEDKNLSTAVCGFMYLNYFSESDLVLLMLVLCDNLRTLELRGQGTCRRALNESTCLNNALDFIGEADDTLSNDSLQERGTADSHKAGLYTIEELSLPDDSTVTIGEILCLLNLPTLRSMYVHYLVPPDERHPSYVTSSLRDLTITHCRASNEDISTILRACASLRSLTIFWDSSQEAHRREDWELLADALLELRDSLQTLHLEYHVDMMPGAVFGKLKNVKVEGIDTLAFMRCLQHLTIPRNALGTATGEIEQFPQTSDDGTDEDSDSSSPDSPGSEDLSAGSTARPEAHPAGCGEQDHSFEYPVPASLKHLTILCEEIDLNEDAAKADMEMLIRRGLDTVTILNCTKDRQFRMERQTRDETTDGNEYSG